MLPDSAICHSRLAIPPGRNPWLVRDFARQAGLTDVEADEVVQETAIALAKNLPEFRYDPKKCRFKTWLHLLP